MGSLARAALGGGAEAWQHAFEQLGHVCWPDFAAPAERERSAVACSAELACFIWAFKAAAACPPPFLSLHMHVEAAIPCRGIVITNRKAMNSRCAATLPI